MSTVHDLVASGVRKQAANKSILIYLYLTFIKGQFDLNAVFLLLHVLLFFHSLGYMIFNDDVLHQTRFCIFFVQAVIS